MVRTSSPGMYSRTSENSMPCPLNTERYSPENNASTSPRVLSSTRFTCLRISGEIRTGRGTGASLGAARRFRRLSTLLRGWYRVENARHDVVARHILSLRLVRDQNSVPKHIGRDRLDVVRSHIRTIPEKRDGTRALRQRERRAGTRAEFYQRCEIGKVCFLRISCSLHDVHDVVDDPVVHVQLADSFPRGEHRFGRRNVPNRDLVLACHASQDFLLLVPRRIADVQLEHEAIDLSLGQRIGTLLLDGILRREHEKRL